MKPIHHHVRKLKEKPEHVRKRIALGTAVGITALVGVVWITSLASTGATFALSSERVDAGDTANAKIGLSSTNVQSNISQLAGAVSAVTNGSSSQPSLTVIDGKTSSTFQQQPANANNTSATQIPF